MAVDWTPKPCHDCGGPVHRRRPIGPFPKRCPRCHDANEIARSRKKQSPRPPCRVCGGQIEEFRNPRARYCSKCRESDRDGMLRRRYGIGVEDVERMVVEQGGRCPICDKDISECRQVVDHCHESGAVRGILCHPCNMLLGFAEDDIDRMVSAISYLQRPTPLHLVFERRPRAVAPCGTYPGWFRHYRNGEAPCAPCVEAHRAYVRDARLRRKEAS